MKKNYFLFLFIFTFYSFLMYSQDTCNDALTITEGVYSASFNNGEPAPLNCINYNNGSQGIWYKYTSTSVGSLTVSTDSTVITSNAGLDTRFHVYSGDCANLVCIGGDDDSGYALTSKYTFNTEVNTTYYIIFDNRWNSDDFQFSLTVGDVVEIPEDVVTFTTQSISNLGTPYVFVDMNNDHRDDLVTVSSTQVNINYQKLDGSFENILIDTPEAQHPPNWSIAAGDLDGNGYLDLLYGGGSGATFMLANSSENSNSNNNYTSSFIQNSPSKYIFSQRTNFIDINNDGLLDAFVCHDVDANVYFINDGNGGLITHQVNDGNSVDLGVLGRNYATLWVDYDNDQDVDMFISKCGGAPDATKNRLYRNNGDGTFTDVSIDSGLNSSVQTWSSAWGDFDNDGFMDVMVGFSTGSGNELMHNNGDGTFTNVTAGSGFDTFDVASHEYIAKDFNNDGWIDVYASGYILTNNGDMTFSPSQTDYGRGAVGDANNDGFLDLFNNNSLKINNNTEGNWLKVNTIGTVSNHNGIGARVKIETNSGSQIRDIRSGVGFKHMSSLTAHFGLGTESNIEKVTVYWPSGNIDVINNPAINTTLNIVENSAPLAVNNELLTNTSIYPNPAKNELTINSNLNLENSIVSIFNIQGKKVYNTRFNSNQIDISKLDAGIYFLRIIQNDKQLNLKFYKK